MAKKAMINKQQKPFVVSSTVFSAAAAMVNGPFTSPSSNAYVVAFAVSAFESWHTKVKFPA